VEKPMHKCRITRHFTAVSGCQSHEQHDKLPISYETIRENP